MQTETSPLVQSGDVSIRRLRDEEQEYQLLATWLADARVLEFYEGRDNPYDLARVRAKFGPRARGRDPVIPCILLYHDHPIGYLQYYPLTAQEGVAYAVESIEGVYGLDLFIGEVDLWNQGIGARAVSAMVRYLFDALGAQRVVIDPHVENHRAIRCYEKSGFCKIKVLPKHELHEGEYRDHWLMAAERGETFGSA